MVRSPPSRSAGPSRLRLTHFGEIAEAQAQLEAAADSLRRTAELARAGDERRFAVELGALIDAQAAEAAERMRAAMPPEQVWLGLERYWRKRRAREGA